MIAYANTVIYSERGLFARQEVFNRDYLTSHDIQITNLKPRTTYDFVIESRDPSGNLVRVGDISKIIKQPFGFSLLPGSAISAAGQTTTAVLAGALNFETNETADDTPPVIISGPRVAYKSNTSALIIWTTDKDADSNVEYSPVQSGAGISGLTGDSSRSSTVYGGRRAFSNVARGMV